MVSQLLGLIRLPSWPSTQNQLSVCLTTKAHIYVWEDIDWTDATLTMLVYLPTTHLSSGKCICIYV